MLAALALTLALQADPCTGMGGLDRFFSCKVFQNDREATNFSAHAAWSIAIPLAGRALYGRRGEWIASGAWAGFTLINEFALHGPEAARERNLNLLSRLGPMTILLVIDLLQH